MRNIGMSLFAAMALANLPAATIDQVIVRQQWPWSTDVKVEYRLSGVTGPVDVKVVEAYDGSTALDVSRINAAASGDVYGVSSSGTWAFRIDVDQAFDKTQSALGDFRVRLDVTESSAQMTETLY